MSRVLVTGITGQDGSYMAELLLKKGYEVWGLIRRSSSPNLWRIEHIKDDIHIIEGDMTAQSSLDTAISTIKPDLVFNYAAQSFVGLSWLQPETTIDVTGLGCLRLLEAIRKNYPSARLLQASSSEQYGAQPAPQNEHTPFRPISPYACAKTLAHNLCESYRRSYGIHVSCAISFNHESERRGVEFVTRKISDGVARIALGLKDKLKLGNMEARRDWGYAPEYVEGHLALLLHDEPIDLVFATGESHSVKEFVIEAFKAAGIPDWYNHVIQDSQFYRPAEVTDLRGDPHKAKEILGWHAKTRFHELVKTMVRLDIDRLN